MSKAKLQEVYNIVNVKWIDFKENGRKNNIGRVTEKSMVLIKAVYKAIQGGRTSGWSMYSQELRNMHGVSCSQDGILQIVKAIEKVFDIVVTKFQPRAKPKRKGLEYDLEWNRSINAIFGGVKCSLT